MCSEMGGKEISSAVAWLCGVKLGTCLSFRTSIRIQRRYATFIDMLRSAPNTKRLLDASFVLQVTAQTFEPVGSAVFASWAPSLLSRYRMTVSLADVNMIILEYGRRRQVPKVPHDIDGLVPPSSWSFRHDCFWYY